MNLYKLNTYLIAGPENINPETHLKNETQDSALIRLVSDFAKRKELAAAAELIIRSSHVFAVSNSEISVSD